MCLSPDEKIFASYLIEVNKKNKQAQQKEIIDILIEDDKKISDEE